MKLAFLPQRMPQGLSDRLGRAVGRLGVTPNTISLIGLAGNVLAAWLVTQDQLVAAGATFLFFSALDMVDGAVARATGQATPYGAVFDAVLDRAGEAILLAGVAWYFGERGEYVQVGLTYAALLGSVAVSYVRARGEVLGVMMRDGLFRRQERVVVMAAGLLFNALTLAIWPMAILTNVTALQRFWVLSKQLRAQDRADRNGA